MAKHHKVVGRIKRRKGFSYYADGTGAIREFKLRRTGAKRGHRTCSAPVRRSSGRKTGGRKTRGR